MIDHEDNVPLCAVLFRGQPNGKIIKRLRKSPVVKPWMKVQAQKFGQYRSEDMVEALDWMLPVANSSDESIIVLLDWFSGHLTEEVAELVRSKGHVLLFHGGGTTAFEQVNDTHLHAQLQARILELENDIARRVRKERLERGDKRMRSVKHEDLIILTQSAWRDIDHKKLSEKGYRSTGPELPMTGPVDPSQDWKELLPVLEPIYPSGTSTEVFLQKKCEDATDFVKAGKDRKWKNWDDYHMLIEPFDDEDDEEEPESEEDDKDDNDCDGGSQPSHEGDV